MVSLESFNEQINREGLVQFNSLLDDALLESLILDLEHAYVQCRNIQLKNGVNVNTDGSLHHVICLGDSFMEFLNRMFLKEYIKEYFKGNYILNSYGAVKNLPNQVSYVGNIHRDIRSFSGSQNLMLNMLVMLDDFTAENGATYFLPSSHLFEEKPSDQYFYEKSTRGIGKRGSIILFNSNLWHAAGVNTSEGQRRALTLTFSKPSLKQQLDYPRFFGYDKMNIFSEDLKQVLGYNARIPTNLEEWYQPAETRFYKPGQG